MEMRSLKLVCLAFFAAPAFVGCDDDRLYRVPSESPAPPGPTDGPTDSPSDAPTPPTCTDETETIAIAAGRRPVDFVFYIDRSGSMAKRIDRGPNRYTLTTDALDALVKDLDPAFQVALQTFPQTPDEMPPDALPADAIGFCAECSAPSCAFETCQQDEDCASGLCRGSLCMCDNRRTCNAGLQCAERFCDGGPPVTNFLDDLQGRIAACVGPTECWDLRGNNQAQCRSFNEVFRDPQNGTAQQGCQPDAYTSPSTAFTGDPQALSMAIERLADIGPAGETPLGPALAGMQGYVQSHQSSSPLRRVVQVVMTDGEPTDCDQLGPDAIRALIARLFDGPFGIPTFVVGVFEPDAPQIVDMNALARVGGTDAALVVHPGSDFANDLAQSLQQIEQTVGACEWALPNEVDPDAVELEVLWASASAERLTFVPSVDACATVEAGWYFDAAPGSGRRPQTARLCPSACREVLDREIQSLRFVVACGAPVRDIYGP